jgi:hypothetical protein
MVETPARPVGGDSGADRLSRVADMLSNAVALLNEAMDEIKTEKGKEDDGTAPGASDRDAE